MLFLHANVRCVMVRWFVRQNDSPALNSAKYDSVTVPMFINDVKSNCVMLPLGFGWERVSVFSFVYDG